MDELFKVIVLLSKAISPLVISFFSKIFILLQSFPFVLLLIILIFIRRSKFDMEKYQNLFARFLGLIIGLFIVYYKVNQQIIAVMAFIIAIFGTNPFNEIIKIFIKKFDLSKKGNFFGYGYEMLDESLLGEVEVKFSELLIKAGKYYNSNDYKSAAHYAELALEIKPDDLELRFKLIFIYGHHIGDKQRAIYHCEKILEKYPKNLDAKFSLAIYTNHLKGSDHSFPIYIEAEKLIIDLKVAEDSEINAKLNLFVGSDYRFKTDKDFNESERRYKKAICLFEKRIKNGDRTGVSEFWLNDTRKNMVELEEQRKI